MTVHDLKQMLSDLPDDVEILVGQDGNKTNHVVYFVDKQNPQEPIIVFGGPSKEHPEYGSGGLVSFEEARAMTNPLDVVRGRRSS